MADIKGNKTNPSEDIKVSDNELNMLAEEYQLT